MFLPCRNAEFRPSDGEQPQVTIYTTAGIGRPPPSCNPEPFQSPITPAHAGRFSVLNQPRGLRYLRALLFKTCFCLQIRLASSQCYVKELLILGKILCGHLRELLYVSFSGCQQGGDRCPTLFGEHVAVSSADFLNQAVSTQ